jgi:hypothetical protein
MFFKTIGKRDTRVGVIYLSSTTITDKDEFECWNWFCLSHYDLMYLGDSLLIIFGFVRVLMMSGDAKVSFGGTFFLGVSKEAKKIEGEFYC